MKDENFYKNALLHAPFGYAYHKILTCKNGKVTDAVFLEVNIAFEKITGCKADQVINRKLSEVMPGILDDKADWLSEYDKMDAGNQLREVQLYSDYLNKWLRVQTYPVEKDHFISTFVDVTEEMRQRKKLQETSDRLNAVLKVLPDMLFIVSSEGEFREVYAPEPSVLYWSEEQIRGKTIFDLFPEEEAKKHISLYKKSIKYGNTQVIEYPLIKEGVNSFFEARIVPLNKVEILAIIRDITEHKLAEKALKDSELRFRALHNASFGGIALHDKGLILECNHGLSVLTGYSEDELIGMNGLLLISEKSRDDVMAKIMSGYEKPYEAIGVTKSGREYPVRIDAKNIPYKSKTIRAAEFRDISDQKKGEATQRILYSIASNMLRAKSLEDLLEHSRRELSQLFNTDNFFMATYDPGTDMLKRVLFKDEKDDFAEWQAGDTFSGRVVKQSETILVKRKDVEQYAAEKNITLKGSIPECWLGVPLIMNNQAVGVMVIQSYDNPEAYDESSASLLEMVARELSLYIERHAMLEDLKKAKEEAEESDRLKSAFLANMSHEIRTPMNGILGFAELLKEPNLKGDQQRKYIGIIEKSGQKMLTLINDMVDISKIESGLMEVFKSETNINEQLRFAYEFFKPEFGKKNIYLTCKMPDEEYIVNTDTEKLNAILVNLLKNAVKYTDRGSVSFGFDKKDDCLEFYVKDTGIGIPANRIHSIFDRFVQADTSSVHAYDGSGLGLAIVKAYVEMLDGEIWVESESGVGSIFSFRLPVK
jgi:PAS domain S-box-containing protein